MDLTFIKTMRGGVVSIHKTKGADKFSTNLFYGKWREFNNSDMNDTVDQMIKINRCKHTGETTKLLVKLTNNLIDQYNDFYGMHYPLIDIAKVLGLAPEPAATDTVSTDATHPECRVSDSAPLSENNVDGSHIEALKVSTISKIRKFFNEFAFNPQNRFINTLCKYAQQNKAIAKNYVNAYMKVIDKPEAASIIEKMKSCEFDEILNNLKEIASEKRVNQRLELLFGPAGSGKTTKAILENPEAEIIICNSSMLPSDLMETFDFVDGSGNPTFKPSAMRRAMVEGHPVIFDEINLLTLDCLRTLQGYLDGKTQIEWKGEIINIKDGFKIVGTMNLEVAGQIYSLPEPLVDRAARIEEYQMTDDMLSKTCF